MQRKFDELGDKSPVASEMLRRITLLNVIQSDVRGRPAEQRRDARNDRSRVIADDLRQDLGAKNRQVCAAAKLDVAIRYAITRWAGLFRCRDDGSIDLDGTLSSAASDALF